MPRHRTVSDEAILAATATVIGRSGLSGLTLARVAAEVDLSPATLVQRFGSKRGLVLALSAAAVTGAARPFEESRRRSPSALTALLDALVDHASDVGSREEMAHHLGVLQLDLIDPEVHEHAASHTHAVRREITALLDAALDRGELVADTDVPALARAVHVTYHGSLIGWALGDDEDQVARALRTDLEQTIAPYRTEQP